MCFCVWIGPVMRSNVSLPMFKPELKLNGIYSIYLSVSVCLFILLVIIASDYGDKTVAHSLEN